ncbi:MAG: SMP-30/gluconolactonase/LRE family protein [Chloracidobacterium sp.]|nr:SMP-30/gluconolactonase/LRE family protein [Chloracidobacterium sp.]MDW8216947.1 hypothetical protein [Acidobacteriota bacterium]
MLKRRTILTAPAVFALCWLWTTPLYAEGTAFWEVTRKEDYLAGRLVGLSVSDNGILRVAPTPKLVGDTQQPFALCSLLVGGEVYIGTGHDGKLFRVGADGATKLVADFEELDVTALATDGKGSVFAATSPEGKIYELTGEKGFRVVYDPPEKYIWAMGCLADGTLVYATGAKGGVFALARGATAVKSLLTTDEFNVTALATAADGAIWVGTDPGGLVIRIAPDGRATAVFDAPSREIRRLVLSPDGTVFALGIGEGKPAASGGGSSGTATETTASEGEGGGAGALRPASGGTTLYRLEMDGRQTAVWTATDTATVLLRRPDGLLVGLGSNTTGGQGRLFLVAPDGRATLVGTVEEERIAAVEASAGDTLYIVTSGLAKLYRLSASAQDEGIFTSAVQDAKAVVEAWGRIVVEGTGEIFVQTRTGNTQTPGALWSEWSAETPAPGGMIASPKARFLQWRLRLKPGAEVTAVRAAYLPKNLAPTISSFAVLPVGVALQEAVVPPPDPGVMTSGLDPAQFGVVVNQPPRKVFQRGARTLQWQAEDKNGDTLTYRLSYRLRGQTAWRPLADKLRNPFFVIAPEALPDGTYEFQLEVSDGASNPPALALTASQVLSPVVITNSLPKITFSPVVVAAKESKLRVEIVTTTAPLKSVEASFNGDDWTLIYPDDLVLDAPREVFTLTYQNLAPGEYLVSVRVLDAALHTTSEKFVLVVKP